jgi:hypothetical protein
VHVIQTLRADMVSGWGGVGLGRQIALLVIPLCILVGWAMGQPLDLNLHVFETTTFILTVISVSFVVQVSGPGGGIGFGETSRCVDWWQRSAGAQDQHMA